MNPLWWWQTNVLLWSKPFPGKSGFIHYTVNTSFIGVKSSGKWIAKEGGWIGLFKILGSLVNSEVEELDLEMIAVLSKKTLSWRWAVCGCPFLWDPCPQTFSSAWCFVVWFMTWGWWQAGEPGNWGLSFASCSCERPMTVSWTLREVFWTGNATVSSDESWLMAVCLSVLFNGFIVSSA